MKKSTKQPKNWVKLLFIVPVAILAAVVAWLVINNVKINNDPSNENNDSQVSQGEKEEDNNTEYDAYAVISDDDIQRKWSLVEVWWDASNPYYAYETSPIAALVHIDSIEGGRNFSPFSQQYTYTQTVGKMTIKEVYKGDITKGTQVNYARLGGIITYDEWFKGQSAEQQELISRFGGEKPAEKYVEEKHDSDINIEVGKDYVVFLQLETTTDGSYKEYDMLGWELGLKEVKIEDGQMVVLNHITGEWKPIDTLIPTDR